MPLVRANPQAEVSSTFESVKAGQYRLRIKEVRDRNPEKNDLEVKLEHVAPAAELLGTDGQALTGLPSGLYDYIQLADDKQWKLRQLTEAVGLPWADYDPVVDLVGREVTAAVKEEPYQGEIRNKIARYIVPKTI